MRRQMKWLAVAALASIAMAAAIPALSPGAATELEATLRGDAEVPEEGDKNGKGDAHVFLKPKKRKVCFALEWSKLTDATAAHIHKGAEGVAGPVKVGLFASEQLGEGAVDGCAKKVKRKLIRRIKKNPAKFYVNVHSSDYPAGAIRGQLELAPSA